MRTIQQQLKEKGLSDGTKHIAEKTDAITSRQIKETFSRKEWEELMGLNRPTYQKQGGTIRRKR